MPELRPEHQSLIDAAAAVADSFASLANLEAGIARADSDYTAAAQARNNAQNTFQEANRVFVANPADQQALANFETALKSLLELSRNVQQLRLARDQADAGDDALVQRHNASLVDLKAKFESFLVSHTLTKTVRPHSNAH